MLTTAKQQMNRENRTLLPRMAFSGFASRYREPAVREGFEDITRVEFRVSLVFVFVLFCFAGLLHSRSAVTTGSRAGSAVVVAIVQCGYIS